MKNGLEQIIGKTIKTVAVNEGRGQVFLIFSDGTYFELYPASERRVNWTSGVDRGGLEEVRHYVHGEKLVVIDGSGS